MRRVTIELQPQKSSPNNKEPGRLTTTTIERERKSPYTGLPKYDEDDEEVKRAWQTRTSDPLSFWLSANVVQ